VARAARRRRRQERKFRLLDPRTSRTCRLTFGEAADTVVPVDSTPQAEGMHMPAEWEHHDATVVAWPARRELWAGQYAEACAVHALVARALARHEPVTMVAAPADRDAAAQACGPTVDVIPIPIDDSWARDSGPVVVVGEAGARAAVDFVFNGWGRKYAPWDDDDALASRLAEHLGLPVFRAPFVLEGGAVAVDGEGTVITTEQCLLHPNRNPGLTRTEIEDGLRAYLGVERVIWIPFGLADDDDTDGHVDNVACFVEPGVVLVQGCENSSAPDHERLAIDRRCLEGTPDAAGRRLEVVEVPVLPHAQVVRGARPVPYLNFYVGNSAVIVPVTGHPADEKMLALIGSCFPGRDIVPVPGAVLAQGGGGVHCITQQVPSTPIP
jgi:agmatine deiminase